MWSSWWRLKSSHTALMAATTSTNSSASVDPHPPKGDTTFHQARQACKGTSAHLQELDTRCVTLTLRSVVWEVMQPVHTLHHRQGQAASGERLTTICEGYGSSVGDVKQGMEHLGQEVEVGHSREHLHKEYGQEGDEVVLGGLDRICDMALHLIAVVDLDGARASLVLASPFALPVVSILVALQRVRGSALCALHACLGSC